MAIRNFVTVETGANATVIEAHVVFPGAAHDAQLNTLTEVVVGKGATLDHAKVAVDEGKALHLSNCDVTLDTTPPIAVSNSRRGLVWRGTA